MEMAIMSENCSLFDDDNMSLRTFWINDTDESLRNEKRFVDIEAATSCRSTMTKDGLKLHPQPTNDSLDPLNWTGSKKHMILGIVMGLYFMFTYITTTTVPSFPELQKLYNITYPQVNLTVAIPSLGLAFGPLFWSSLSDIYGRRLIFIIGTSIAFVATVGAALSKSYSTYMAARFFQGFGVSPGGTVGMAIINDVFFDYERGQKLGLWVLAINTGLLVGPIVGGFVDLIDEFWIDWVAAMMFGFLLIMELAFLPETLYPRGRMHTRLAMTKTFGGEAKPEQVELKRTKTLPFINLAPLPGMRHPMPWDSMLRFGMTFKYLTVFLTVCVYCFSWYWWILSIITFIPAAYAQYSPSSQGLLFFGLLLGSWFAELFCSGRLSDWIIEKLSQQNGGVRVPEMRLWLAYPAAALSAAGLVLWGISIDKRYHWMVGQIAFFLFAMGLQMGNTVIPSYIIDCYPLQSMSVITFYSVLLDLSALINPFFIGAWVSDAGYTVTFATQGIITFCVVVPVIAFVHVFGPKIRERVGEPSWVNPEYENL